MTYYDTLAEDLARAKEILARGRDVSLDELTEEQVPERLRTGTIYGADTYAAYKLLESFVEQIEQFQLDQRLLSTTLRNVVVAVCGDDDWEGTVAEAIDLLNARFAAIQQRLDHEGTR